jgi:hypothetical protein
VWGFRQLHIKIQRQGQRQRAGVPAPQGQDQGQGRRTGVSVLHKWKWLAEFAVALADSRSFDFAWRPLRGRHASLRMTELSQQRVPFGFAQGRLSRAFGRVRNDIVLFWGWSDAALKRRTSTGVLAAVAWRGIESRIRIKTRVRGKVKGDGQECPSYMGRGNGCVAELRWHWRTAGPSTAQDDHCKSLATGAGVEGVSKSKI